MTSEAKPAAALAEGKKQVEVSALGWLGEPGIYMRVLSVLAIVGSWEVLGLIGYISPAIFSYPSAIIAAFFVLLFNGQMLAAAQESSIILVE